MRKNFSCLVLMCISISLSAQFNDSFTDGNFTADPTWSGNTADWQIVANSDVAAGAAGSNTLRLSVAAGSGITYLSTQIAGSWGAAQSWGFFVGRRGQAYTAANHVFIWLWASEPNLTSATVHGYRIRIGDDSGGDEIILQRVMNGIATDIISGAALTNNLTDIGFLLRVTRSISGNWELFTSVLPVANGTGAVATDIPNAVNAAVLQGTATDNTYTAFDDGHFGFANAYGSGTLARASQEFDQVHVSFTAAVMPVKLERFEALKEGAAFRLLWSVSEETGVQHYEVQRSDMGIHFSTIGTVKATNARWYAFIDNQPGAENRFYRLRIPDIDGTAEFSHIVSVRSKHFSGIKAAPNPTRGIVNIEHSNASPGGRMQVLNAAGKPLKQIIIHENASLTPVDLSELPAGLYYVVLIINDQRQVVGVIKRN